MLSILIPVYNFNVTSLIGELLNQAEKLNIQFEIICIDDKSKSKFLDTNDNLRNLENVNYQILKENIGRSKIRNLLASESKYEYLLFLDCDIKISNPDFLEKYINQISKNDVIIGGLEYESLDDNTDKNKLLRWAYGKNREEKKAINRSKNPYLAFSVCNLLIKKSVSEKILFSEIISQYGHEDTLYGIELKAQKVKVKHIDNPVIHLGLDETDVFIKKTELGLENLKSLSNNYPGIIKLTKIGRYYTGIRRTLIFSKPIFKLTKSVTKSLLLNGSANLLVFDLYKLSFLLCLEKQ